MPWGSRPSIEGWLGAPQPLDTGTALLSLDAALARGGRGPGRSPLHLGAGGTANEIDKAVECILPIAHLRPMPLRGEDDNAVTGQSRTRQAFQPRTNVRRQRRRMTRIEAKLDCAGNLVDVLPAWAGSADELFNDLPLIKRDSGVNADHARA